MELLYGISFICSVILLYLLFTFIRLFFKFWPEERDKLNKKDHVPVFQDIKERSDEILGIFQDLLIHRFITLDNDKVYEYESIAIEAQPGVYYSKHLNSEHIVIDKKLLYRIVE
jgi:hypothetical protein